MKAIPPICFAMGAAGLGLYFGLGASGGPAAAPGLLLYATAWLVWGLTAGRRLHAAALAGAGDDPEPEVIGAALARGRSRGLLLLILAACLSTAPVLGLLAVPAVLGAGLACLSASLAEPARRPLGRFRRGAGGFLLVLGWLGALGTALGTAQLAAGLVPGSALAGISIWWALAPLLVALGTRLHAAMPPRDPLRRAGSVASLFLGVAVLGLLLRDILPRGL
jgi:hypothetical protein